MVTRSTTSRVTRSTTSAVTGNGVSGGTAELPELPSGYEFVVDGSGNYLRDSAGNYIIAPIAPSESVTITEQPTSTTVNEGQTATFTVTASGSPTYQWQLSNDSGANWSDVSGATSSSYTTAATVRSTDNNDQYRVGVTIGGTTEYSNAATLTVFNPLAISGLTCWLEAWDGATVLNLTGPDTPATDGQTVVQWSDKSGNSNHATQTGIDSIRPVYVEASDALSFDDVSDVIVLPRPSTNGTMFFVLDLDETTRFIGVSDAGGGNRFFLVGESGSTAASNAGLGPSVTHRLNGASATLTQRQHIYTNLATSPGIVTITGHDWASSTWSANLRISGFTGWFMNGLVKSVIFYDSVLSTENIELVESYLSYKSGISI